MKSCFLNEERDQDTVHDVITEVMGSENVVCVKKKWKRVKRKQFYGVTSFIKKWKIFRVKKLSKTFEKIIKNKKIFKFHLLYFANARPSLATQRYFVGVLLERCQHIRFRCRCVIKTKKRAVLCFCFQLLKMSRIIIKNLPNGIAEQKLRDHFGTIGIVTDVQLKYTPDGKFRKFGFIGFEDDDAGNKAIKQFNNTFLRTSKLSVELCAALDDENKPKPLSKYSKAKLKEVAEKLEPPKKEKVEVKTAAQILKKHKNDPQFQEFLKAHKKGAAWDNNFDGKEDEESGDDDSKDSGNEPDVPKEEESKKTKKKKINEEDMLDLYVVKIKNMPCDSKRKDLTKFFKPLKTFSIRIPPRKKGFAYVGFKNESELRKALLKDKSFLGGHQVQVIDFTQKDRNRTQEKAKKDNPRWIKQKESVTSENICETGKLFFRNLSYTVKEENLQKLLEKFGPIADLHVPIDANTRKLKGFGTVTFVMPEHAVKAFTCLNGTMFHGRMFHLLPGNNNESNDDQDDSKLGFKEKKEKKLKQNAGSSYNWNTLFMGENVVADILAKKYGESKEKILSDDGTSAAVRLALGETEIVIEMRKFLEKNDISVEAFDNLTENRSKTVIMAKNLPAHTTKKEIRDMFIKFGLLGRVVLPPSGVTAVIEFLEPSEAKKAFKNLAYSKFKNLPLYLEWAPEKSFKTDFIKKGKDENVESEEESESETEEIVQKSEIEKEEIGIPEDNTTLFVKNLDFEIRNDSLRAHFKNIGQIYMAQVVTKGSDSRGYGFIQFMTKKAADKALKLLQFSELGNRKIELSRSDRKVQIDPTVVRKGVKAIEQTGTKILVRNIPFQANIKEIRDLFKVFGEIRTIRLPKKMTPGTQEQHRGFCFVEYGTNVDAKSAFDALSSSTHLYGRRLVLEWAAPDEDVEMLRKRTAKEFAASSSDGKRSRKAVFDTANIAERETGGDHMDDDDEEEDD